MKAVLKLVACTVLVLFIGRELVWLFVSDETKIRWTVEKMVDGFNDARLSKAISGLHPNWRVTGMSIDRPLLADGIRSVFFTEKHPETRAFALEALALEDSFEIQLLEDEAEVEFVVQIHRLGDGDPVLEWEVAIRGPWVRDEERGWVARESTYESLQGDSPGRRRPR